MKHTSKLADHAARQIAGVSLFYPKKNIKDIANIFVCPAIQFNAGVGVAIDKGWIDLDKTTGEVSTTPVFELDFVLSNEVNDIRNLILVSMEQLAVEEADIEDNYLSNFLAGFPSQDIICAVESLIREGKLCKYTLTNQIEIEPTKKQKQKGKKARVETEDYIFYTLPENLSHRWGKKQFADEDRVTLK